MVYFLFTKVDSYRYPEEDLQNNTFMTLVVLQRTRLLEYKRSITIFSQNIWRPSSRVNKNAILTQENSIFPLQKYKKKSILSTFFSKKDKNC